jgi:hypothetical protein
LFRPPLNLLRRTKNWPEKKVVARQIRHIGYSIFLTPYALRSLALSERSIAYGVGTLPIPTSRLPHSPVEAINGTDSLSCSERVKRQRNQRNIEYSVLRIESHISLNSVFSGWGQG